MSNLTYFTPTKVRLRYFTLDGINMKPYIQNIKVYESMCTPYIKCDITAVINQKDPNPAELEIVNFFTNNLKNKPVKFAFDDGLNIYERTEQLVFTIESQPSEENKTVTVYSIATMGESYTNDRQSLVQSAFVNIPAMSAASKVHNQYIGTDAALKFINSKGMIAKDTIGSFPISNIKPWAAIDKLVDRAVFANSESPVSYFRDKDQYVMGPLQDIIRSSSASVSVIEKATWGASIADMFEHAHYSIMASAVLVEQNDADSKSGSSQTSAAAFQGNHIFDIAKGAIDLEEKAKAVISGLVNKIPINTSGGMININAFNSLRNELAHDPSIKLPGAHAFIAKVRDATKYLIKIPIRPGLQTTVGNGIDAKILAPGGTQVGGHLVVADLMHDCYFDKRQTMGTSTIRGVKKSDVT